MAANELEPTSSPTKFLHFPLGKNAIPGRTKYEGHDGEALPAAPEFKVVCNLHGALSLAVNLVVSRAEDHGQAQSTALELSGTRVACTDHGDVFFISDN
jgi:hypothetical protein